MGNLQDLYEEANEVMYRDYSGTVSVDIADMHGLAEFLGLDPYKQLLVRADLYSFGGHQTASALGADLEGGNLQDLIEQAKLGTPIKVRRVEVLDCEPDDHNDTNPPRLTQFPAKSITELLEHAFKRLHITLIAGHDSFPVGTQLEIE